METFAQDVRMASSSNWVASNSVIISTQYNSAPIQYTYVFNKSTSTSRPNGTLTRQRTYPTTGAVDTLILNVKTFTFTAYDINTNPVNLGTVTSANTDTADINTKQIQVSIETQRSSPTLSISTNKVMSARFILRNKSVTA